MRATPPSRRLGPAPLPLRGIPPPAGTGSGPRRRLGRAGRRVAPGWTGHGGRFRLPHRPHRTTVKPPSGWCTFRWPMWCSFRWPLTAIPFWQIDTQRTVARTWPGHMVATAKSRNAGDSIHPLNRNATAKGIGLPAAGCTAYAEGCAGRQLELCRPGDNEHVDRRSPAGWTW